ncbi:hypothetical protein N0V90_013545 [Kalmusia sp. IMI 367209]|nr:hypothetical protein N0V90_013545 [Kalmusia sp. IMI 367209]
MADNMEVGSVSAPEHQVETAAEALLCFQKSAEDFFRYKHIYTEAVETKKAHLRMQTELREKDNIIQELESAISVFTLGGNKEVNRMKVELAEVRKDNMDQKKRFQQVNSEKRETEAQVEETRQLLAMKAKESARLQIEISELKTKEQTRAARFDAIIAGNKDMASRLSAAKMQLDVYDGYTANLVDLNITKFSRSIARIWECTDALVKKYFSPDVPADSLIENHDQWIQQACSFLRPPSGSILIPSTNSAAAKFARQAVTLNIIAHTLCKWIFTGAPMPFAQAGIDDVLFQLMKQDAKKELLFRAMLISGSAKVSLQEKDIQELVKWFLEAFGTLLRPKARTDMKTDLRKILEDAMNCWTESQRSRHKVVATFDCESYPDSWESYSGATFQHKHNAKHTQISDPEDEDEVAFFAFPAVIVRSSDTVETVHRGLLIYYSHLIEAENEWRKEQKKRRFSRTGVPHNIVGLPSFSSL